MAYKLNNSIIKNPDGKVKYKLFQEGGYEYYHVGVWLEADTEREMDRVQYVEYELHPTFKQRTRKSNNRANDFSITFWSWGTFEIKARIYLVDNKDGQPEEITRQLRYELPAGEENYTKVP